MFGTLETNFQGQKSFRLVKGSLSWWEMPDFHKQLYFRNQASDTPLLILAHFEHYIQEL